MRENLIELTKEVHENAKAHGWWDKPRNERSVRALIVSEWSEALEEARKGRPLEWHACKDAGQEPGEVVICEECSDCVCKRDTAPQDCRAFERKPEGVAIELIDGCIRIMDYMGYLEYDTNLMPSTMEAAVRRGLYRLRADGIDPETTPADEMVDVLTEMTMMSTGGYGKQAYVQAMCAAFAWVQAQGMDPEKLIVSKHSYNKTRTYKHGKLF